MSEKSESSFWPAFLPEIEEALETALNAVGVQEQALASLTQTEPAELGRQLENIRDRIFGLKTCVDRREQAIAEFDALLQTSENEVRGYFEEIDGLRQRLADWAGRAIG
jgi:chromosome segregation ATPase